MKRLARVRGLVNITAVVFSLLSFPVFSIAGTHPNFLLTDVVRQSLWAPDRVAEGPDGKIYVTEGYKNRVLIYNRKGSNIGMLQTDAPSAIAVDDSGRIYIGSSKRGVVEIYSADKTVGSLGSGDGEFLSVYDITVDGNIIYVVDGVANEVKIFNSDGSPAGMITEGLNMPRAAASANGEVYIINSPLMADPYRPASRIRGASIEVFDVSGTHLRTIGDFGTGQGQFKNPTDIFAGRDGRLYVSDAYHSVVLVYDTYGNYLGAIYDDKNPMYTTMSVVIGKDNRLIASSLNSAELMIFGVDNYTFLGASPSSLTFDAQVGKPAPSPQTVTVSNTGKGTLAYNIAASGSYLSADNVSGSVPGGSSVNISVAVDPAGLAEGGYMGALTITDNAGAGEVVNVVLNVHPGPSLRVSLSSLAFVHTVGDSNPVPQTVMVTLDNDLFNTSTWTAVTDTAWISVAPAQATGNTTTGMMVSVNASGLPAGVYSGSVVISAGGVSGAPAVVGVTLEVMASGKINVTTDTPEAAFAIDGPKNYSGSGNTWSVSNVPEGSYTITFKEVSGYRSPGSITKILTDGGIITFAGHYTRKESGEIVVSPVKGKRSGTLVKVYSSDGSMIYKFTPFDGYRGGITTAVADINGDGTNEIIAGLSGEGKPALVSVFDNAGNKLNEFEAFADAGDERMTAGDLDGDGSDEIIVSGAGNGAAVKVFRYAVDRIVDTGISFVPGRSLTAMAAGDLDGDGVKEIVTLDTGSVLQVWRVDINNRVQLDKEVYLGENNVRDLAVGDLDGDGIDDVLVATNSSIASVDVSGSGLTTLIRAKGINSLAIGDVNGDGDAEIVIGMRRGRVKVYSSDGMEISVIKTFRTKSGVRISLGELGY
ncbi:FG-GAP repeat protein [bacterium BMS3Abin07]|nr:FG-GAP repeat protein [bacterium BMS3Abin07]GBE32190.1 FG-GAP repeat protein [bacterium BMS3Bbin05]